MGWRGSDEEVEIFFSSGKVNAWLAYIHFSQPDAWKQKDNREQLEFADVSVPAQQGFISEN